MNKSRSTELESSYLFSVIGEQNRLKVLKCLFSKSLNVGQIQEFTGIEKTSLSKHLKILRSAGIIDVSRKGRNLYYRVNPELSPKNKKGALNLHCCEILLRYNSKENAVS